MAATLFASAPAAAQSGQPVPSVRLSVKSRDIYANVPFTLQVAAVGFEDSPQPTVADFKISGAKIRFQGVQSQVSSSTANINGRLRMVRQVAFVYNYEVQVAKSGSYKIPPIVVSQGSTTATGNPTTFQVGEVNETTDMRISLAVPERPVWLGESFEVDIVWDLRKNPRGQSFVIPIFQHPAFEIEAPEGADSAERLAFEVDGNPLELPYENSNKLIGGAQYTRFKFRAIATPLQSGTFDLEAPRVIAKLETGTGRDSFGFRSPTYTQFKATGKPTQFTVKPLPSKGRPDSFSNAVGSGFSIEVSTSRSVVSVGEPIELTVVLRGQRGLEGLSLPPMLGAGRLDETLFDMVSDDVTGIVADDAQSKTFKVTVVLNSAKAREIPPIEFAYFDPEAGTYKTSKSQPIALNVRGSSLVGAEQVVASKRDSKRANNPDAPPPSKAAFAGDLTPSSGDTTLRTMTTLATIGPLLGALYAIPLLLLLAILWLRRTGDSRGRTSEVRTLFKAVEEAAERSKREAAQDSAGPLINSLRELAKLTGNKPGAYLAEIEQLAFDPQRRSHPVDSKLVANLVADARGWTKQNGGNKSSTVAAALVVLLGITTNHSIASAANLDSQELQTARESYLAALSISERADRTAAFAATERLYRKLVQTAPGHPELLTDWGNAALGAGDLGTAALAYRRALQLDRGIERAQKNLQWIRQAMPGHLVADDDPGAADSLFFWHSEWSLARRHTVAAIAFALAILLWIPKGRYQLLLRRIAILPGLLFAATFSSALLDTTETDAAVVVEDGHTLYSADSTGAPPAMSAPVPAGVEVSLKTRQGNWTQVALANGTTGWLNSNAVIAVTE